MITQELIETLKLQIQVASKGIGPNIANLTHGACLALHQVATTEEERFLLYNWASEVRETRNIMDFLGY